MVVGALFTRRRQKIHNFLLLCRFLERQASEEEEAIVSNKQVAFWMDLIRTNSTPRTMTVRFEPIAVRAVVKAIAHNSSLVAIDLCNCNLQDDVGVEIGRMLAVNTHLRRLVLDYNRFGPKSLAALGDGLSRNTTIESLSLEANPLSGESLSDFSGIAAFTRMLANNTSLANLNLYQTGLQRDGGRHLLRAMQSNSTLTCLQLSPTDEIETSDLSALTDILRDNARTAAEVGTSEKLRRATERKLAAEHKKVEDKLSSEAAEEAWVLAQKEARRKAREDADFAVLKAARAAMVEREAEYKEMRARWKAEAEAKKPDAGAAAKKKKK